MSAPADIWQAYGAVVDRIYAGIGCGAGWNATLDRLGRFLNAQTTVLECATSPGRSLFLAAGAHSSCEDVRAWETRGPEAVFSYGLRPGQALLCNDYDERPLSPALAELLQRHAVARSISCAIGDRDGRYFFFHAARSHAQPPYTDEEAEWVCRLVGHMQRAIGLETMVADHGRDAALALAAMFGMALFLVGGDGVEALNRSAERMPGTTLLVRGHGLAVRGDAAATQDLARLIDAAQTLPDADGGLVHVGALRVVDADGGATHIGVKSMPVTVRPFGFRERKALVYVEDGRAARRGLQPALRELFGLTPAEARIAGLIAQGVEFVDIPARVGIRPSTMRFHLEGIYGKLGVATKGALIARLVRVLPFLDVPAALNA